MPGAPLVAQTKSSQPATQLTARSTGQRSPRRRSRTDAGDVEADRDERRRQPEPVDRHGGEPVGRPQRARRRGVAGQRLRRVDPARHRVGHRGRAARQGRRERRRRPHDDDLDHREAGEQAPGTLVGGHPVDHRGGAAASPATPSTTRATHLDEDQDAVRRGRGRDSEPSRIQAFCTPETATSDEAPAGQRRVARRRTTAEAADRARRAARPGRAGRRPRARRRPGARRGC